MANHMFDHLIDHLEAEQKRGASAGGAKKRPEKDRWGRKFMTDRDVEKHMQALRVFSQFDANFQVYNGDHECIAGILGADKWFKDQGLILTANLDLQYRGDYNNDACNQFFGVQASHDEEYVEIPEGKDDEYDDVGLIGYDYRTWWDCDGHEVSVGDLMERIRGLLRAHGIEP